MPASPQIACDQLEHNVCPLHRRHRGAVIETLRHRIAFHGSFCNTRRRLTPCAQQACLE